MQDIYVLVIVLVIVLGFVLISGVTAYLMKSVLVHIKDLELLLKSQNVVDYEVMKDIQTENTTTLPTPPTGKEEADINDVIDFNTALQSGLIPEKLNL